MSSTNLTHIEAQKRASTITDVHYDVSLDLTDAAQQEVKNFSSHTKVSFSTTENTSTFIDVRAAQIESVILDGQDITLTAAPLSPEGVYIEEQGIQLTNLTEGAHELEVQAQCVYSSTGEGLHRFTDPEDNHTYLYTQFETDDAKRVFTCFDQPDIKATYGLSVTAPIEWTVVTNNTVERAELDTKAVSYTDIDYPLSTYLIAFCVGPWFNVMDSWTGKLTPHSETAQYLADNSIDVNQELTVPLGLFCRQSLARHMDTEELFTVTKQGFDFFHSVFGIAYPFYKYDQVFCPEYNMGAMENAGCVTLRDEYIFSSKASHYQYERRADTILHELAHMWFGDLVTMQWWDDLWLNESFATWSSAFAQANATQYKNAWTTFSSKDKPWAYAQDQLPSTHPVVTDAPDVATADANFDGITYAKGASVLKQLVAYVGIDAFLSGIRTHFAQHAYGNATFADLRTALEQASSKNLQGWAQEWLQTTGVTTLTPTVVASDGTYTSVTVSQTPSPSGSVRDHRLMIGLYDLEGDALQQRTQVDVEISDTSTTIDVLTGQKLADLLLVNDSDLTYSFVLLDDASLHTALNHIQDIQDPMARALIWSSIWEMVRNTQIPAKRFVRLVAQAAHAETEMSVLEQILLQSRTAMGMYTCPEFAEEGWAMLRSAFLTGAREAEPGSSAQLSFLRAFIRCQHDADSLHTLEDLLAGSTIIPGLDMDSEITWSLLTAIIAAGAGKSELSAEDVSTFNNRISQLLEKDNTSQNQMYAEMATAAIPTHENKQAVWTHITQDGASMTNLSLRYQSAGLLSIGSTPLLEKLTPVYAEVALPLWNSLSPEMALRTLEELYPLWDHRQETTESIKALVNDAELPQGLKRVLSEGISRAERAHRARESDKQDSVSQN